MYAVKSYLFIRFRLAHKLTYQLLTALELLLGARAIAVAPTLTMLQAVIVLILDLDLADNFDLRYPSGENAGKQVCFASSNFSRKAEIDSLARWSFGVNNNKS